MGLSAISLAFFLFEQGTKATFFLPSFPAPFSNVRHERPHVTATSSPVLSFLLSPSSAGRVFLFLSLFLYSLIPLFRLASFVRSLSSSSPSPCFSDLFRNCNFTAVHCVVMNCGKGKDHHAVDTAKYNFFFLLFLQHTTPHELLCKLLFALEGKNRAASMPLSS